MIIANRTANTQVFEFEYMVDGPGGLDVRIMRVSVDQAPNAEELARKVFLNQLQAYGERDRRYSFNEC